METPNLAIFDKNTAFNLATSLEEISGKPRYGIDLYSPDTSRINSIRQLKSNTSYFSSNRYDVKYSKSGENQLVPSMILGTISIQCIEPDVTMVA